MGKSNLTKFWNFKAVNEGETELLLYGLIADDEWDAWLDGDVYPKQFYDDLTRAGDVSTITVRINSYGGSVFAGHAMHSILKAHKAQVIVHIDGIAASAASVVAMAGDRIIMPSNSMMMIHNPMSIALGDAEEMRKVADTLDRVKDSIVAAYRDRTGLSEDRLAELMDQETWMTAAQARELGFADEVEEAVRVAASIGGGSLVVNGTRFDLGRMMNIPAALFAGEEVNNMDETNKQNGGQTEEEPKNVPEETAGSAADGEGSGNGEGTEAGDGSGEGAGGDADQGDGGDGSDAGNDDPVQAAVNAALTAERARINALNELRRPGAEEIINAAIESGQTPEATALQILKSPGVRNRDTLADRMRDAEVLNGVQPGKTDGAAGGGKGSRFLSCVDRYASALGLKQPGNKNGNAAE